MGKIFDNINGYIMEAMKAKEPDRANAYKNIKAKMLEFKTAKNAKPLDDAAEISIIKKMVVELHNDAAEFVKNNRNDLADNYNTEASYLEPFLPKEASENEIRNVINNYIAENGQFEQKQMGIVIKYVKEILENVDGSLLAKIVKTYF